MNRAVRGAWRRVHGRAARCARAATVLLALSLPAARVAAAQDSARALAAAWPTGTERSVAGRFTVFAARGDRQLATAMLREAAANDTFPGLARPVAAVTILIAPDAARFREWSGRGAPEWGAAVAFPAAQRLVIQGHRAPSAAGDPRATLRHELAHLALHEAMGDAPPRWFDEGYAAFAAGEWGRDEVIATNLALVVHGMPGLDELDTLFTGGASRAEQGYALSQRAVADLAALDPQRGLAQFFVYWRETGSFDQAVRRAYGLTQDGFEKRWKSNTRKQFGGLALFANVTVGALLMLLLIGPFWLVRRQRDRARLLAMRASDALLERRQNEDALEALLHGSSGAGAAERGSAPPRGEGGTNENQIK